MNEGRAAATVVATFVVVGVALAAVTVVAGVWADAQFAAGASGDAVDRFGPVFRALVALQTTVAALLVAPALSAVLGVLAGSRVVSPGRAGLVAGAGGFVGAGVATGLVAVAAVSTGGGQAFPLATALVPVGVAAVGAGVAGAFGGAAGSTLVR